MRHDRYPGPDPEVYDHGVGTLSVDGELEGHLACVVGRMYGGARWPWFVIVWRDRTKELAFEDYGPDWPTVRELDAGYLDHHGPSTVKDRRFLGLKGQTVTTGPPRVFDFAWLPHDEAAARWIELGLTDDDF